MRSCAAVDLLGQLRDLLEVDDLPIAIERGVAHVHALGALLVAEPFPCQVLRDLDERLAIVVGRLIPRRRLRCAQPAQTPVDRSAQRVWRRQRALLQVGGDPGVERRGLGAVVQLVGVFAQLVEQRTLRLGGLHHDLCGVARREGREAALPVPSLDVLAATLTDVAARVVAIDMQRLVRTEDQLRIQQAEHAGVGVGEAVVRRRGQEQQVLHVLGEGAREGVAQHVGRRLARPRMRPGAQVRLVDDRHVPAVLQDLRPVQLEVVHRRDADVVCLPR